MLIKMMIFTLLTTGALNENAVPRLVNLYSDNRAYRINDIVTIIISESSSASETARTSTSKGNDLQSGVSALWNANIAGNLFGEEGGSPNYPSLNISSDHSFNGTGTTSRQGSFTAQIAAVVKEVQPNGNLIIEGKRTILINEEQKNMTISGVVRPEDISTGNTVSSSKVADAQISYDGQGPITAKARQGWIMRFFDWIPIF